MFCIDTKSMFFIIMLSSFACCQIIIHTHRKKKLNVKKNLVLKDFKSSAEAAKNQKTSESLSGIPNKNNKQKTVFGSSPFISIFSIFSA